jgi:hypothetical protein
MAIDPWEQAVTYSQASDLYGQGPEERAMLEETEFLMWPVYSDEGDRALYRHYGDQGHHVKWREDGTMVHSYRSVE